MVRYNADPLVGPASFRHKYYSASGLEQPNIWINDDDGNTLQDLFAKGFVLDEIKETWNSSAFGAVPAEWLAAANWTDEKRKPPGELWRTLVADRNASGEDTDRWVSDLFHLVASHLTLLGIDVILEH
jgi:hypothetical protein